MPLSLNSPSNGARTTASALENPAGRPTQEAPESNRGPKAIRLQDTLPLRSSYSHNRV